MATTILRPTGDVKADWTEDAVGTAWSKLDDDVLQPTAPTTGSDRITTTGNGTICTLSFGTFTLGAQKVTSVTLWVYGQAVDGSNFYNCTVSIPNIQAGTLASAAYTSASFGWVSGTGTRPITQAQLDGIEVGLTSAGATGTREIDAAYLEVVTKNRRPNRIGGRRRFFRG